MYQYRETDKLEDKRNRLIRQMISQGKPTKVIIATVNALVEEPRPTEYNNNNKKTSFKNKI